MEMSVYNEGHNQKLCTPFILLIKIFHKIFKMF